MEANTCNVNYLDADALLPPRKRLLAGLKKQNSDVYRPVPLPLTPDGAGSENDGHSNVYRSQLNTPSLSNEEIVEASRIAAIEAAKVAKTARANAEEKAARAARAVAAVKTALELVATLSEEATRKENFPKKSKTKKHCIIKARVILIAEQMKNWLASCIRPSTVPQGLQRTHQVLIQRITSTRG